MTDSFKDRISNYSLKELLETESSLDKARFPDKHVLIQDEIVRRRTAGEYVTQAYACPSCRKLTISHCDMQKTSIIKCSECGEENYLDPYRSVAASAIGGIGLFIGAYQSMWFVLIGLIVMFILRDKWTTFVPKEIAARRTNSFNILAMVSSSLMGLLFTIWAIFTDPSQVPNPRYGFIALMAITTMLAFGFTIHFYKKRKRIKN